MRTITYDELIKSRGWNTDLISLYLKPLNVLKGGMHKGKPNYDYQDVIKIENYLTKHANINYKRNK